jgi:ATP-binding cassette, subfamily C, bacterial CydD
VTRTESADAWLAEAVAPGRRWFDLSAAAAALETVLVMVRWAGLAWTAQGVMDGDRARAARGLVAVAVAGLLTLGAAWAAGEARERGGRAVSARLRERLAGALLPAGRRNREATPSAAALAMVDLVDDVADHAAQTEPLRRSAPPAMVAVLAITAALHWPAAIVLLLSTALLPVNMWLAGVITKAGTDQQLAATQQLGAVVLDSFRGLATLRELGAVERRGRMLADAGEQLNKATMAVLRRAFLSATMMDVVITFSIAVNATYIGLSLLGYTSVPFAPRLTLFTGLLVLLVCPMFFGPLRARAAAFHQRERAATAARTIADMVGDGPAATDPPPQLRIPDAVGVSLTTVRYRYEDADEETVTADVDLPPGTWTAITGVTGAGKSTLLSLIAGLRVPTGGRVAWQTARGRCAPVLGGCAWIGQRTVLLDATVRDNIRLGCPDATEHQIRRAVDAAGLTGVLERLPGGLDARLGEGGAGISTGEARRIAIARAFLRGAGLWLLDEPTAHLDADSEQTVVAALRRATEGCTVIVATHSPALVAAADTLLVLDDGVLQDADLARAA